MSLQFVLNLILVLCVVGMLALFLRKFSEVSENAGQQSFEFSAEENQSNEMRAKSDLFKDIAFSVFKFFKNIFLKLVKSVWHFMLEAKDLKQGQILASKFVRLMPNRPKVMNIGAHSKMKKAERLYGEGRIDESEQAYYEVIVKHPREYNAYEGLIKIYLKQKKYSEIIETLEYLIKHNPGNDQYFAQLGNILMTTRRYREALAAYEKSLQINYLIPARFANAGLCYEALGEYNKATEYFKKALDLEPVNTQYLMMLVDNLLKLDENNLAVGYLEKARDMDPENVFVKERLIEIKAKVQA